MNEEILNQLIEILENDRRRAQIRLDADKYSNNHKEKEIFNKAICTQCSTTLFDIKHLIREHKIK